MDQIQFLNRFLIADRQVYQSWWLFQSPPAIIRHSCRCTLRNSMGGKMLHVMNPLEEVTYEERCWLPLAQRLIWVWWMERDRKTKASRHFRKHALCTGHRERPGKEVNITEMINCIPTKVSFPKHMQQARLISGI